MARVDVQEVSRRCIPDADVFISAGCDGVKVAAGRRVGGEDGADEIGMVKGGVRLVEDGRLG